MTNPLDMISDPAHVRVPFLKQSKVPANVSVIPVHIMSTGEWDVLKSRLSERELAYAQDRKFAAEGGQILRVPGEDGTTAKVLMGVGETAKSGEGELQAGLLARRLPEAHYIFESLPHGWDAGVAMVGWAMGAYQFTPYLSDPKAKPILVVPDSGEAEEAELVGRAMHFGRGLIDSPAGDVGPVGLEQAARQLADEYEAELSTVVGRELLEQNYPMIHAVGRAAHEAPRLVEFEWGDPSHPRLAVVGKGITFDTGGVNMKSASGARLMKKDMGGAAHALALSMMIMGAKLPVRLHCLIAIAENAVSAGAYRPGDILTARSGLTVEIDNTDAEGRLVLGDTLVKAGEDDPRLIIDFATLTGAARVALGPQLPPFFCNREGPVEAVLSSSAAQCDPIWRMPLWQNYNRYLSSPIADMKNAGGSFAGSVTAALFLERFVGCRPWMHFDVYGWNPDLRPASPKGAELYAVRGLFAWLKGGGLNAKFD